MNDMYLLESNGEGVLTEATTAHEEVVLADQTTASAADTAERAIKYVKNLPVGLYDID